ncbi:tectonin beta-propeller repeat-containing peroxin 23 isoform X1 [Rhodnius prolixus]|uniref:tectonin beta-propeller repeat-containing peroxin 23 isoform X1 n=1 Tax=Rhodnius prolixus TaxID=13249 RepID=UPI003D18EEBA
MPSSMLFAVNNEGRVFGLSTNGTKWREFPYLGLDFKHLSAVPNFLWAVGGDRQIYVHVHGLDIPIKVKEEAYENQRWYPLDGFSKRLLPTDRYQFSSEDGLIDRNRENIRVPSMAWQWEGDWYIETVMNGEPLDHDGWTYAVDFPATYYSTQQWTSCVRRRKWVRSRKYCAMNSWCAIAPLHKDPTQEPFIDVSVGGQSMNDNQGALQVWAVTAHGRVMWRNGVSIISPEGSRWNAVPMPAGCEVKNISCGATGLVWAVLWSGKALVRTGVSLKTPMGEGWLEVESPDEEVKLIQVSVGVNSVWAVTADRRVWFRKGIKGETAASDELARGSGWVEMVGDMSLVSVAPNDQVFAVGVDDRSLYFRVGVTPAELTGKRWKCLQAAVQLSRTSSTSSYVHVRQHHSTASLNNSSGSVESIDWLETSRSAPTSLKIQPVWQKPVQPRSLPASEGSVEEPYLLDSLTLHFSENREEKPQRKLTAWSPIRSVGSLLGLEAKIDTDPHADWDGVVYPERETICEPGWFQADTLWSCVEAGALSLNVQHLPNWFVENTSSDGLETAPWRSKILGELKRVNSRASAGFDNYEIAIEMTSCVKSIECRCCLAGQKLPIFEDCILQLEWVGSNSVTVDTASLSVLSLDKKLTMCQLSLSEVVCISSASEPGCPRIAIHTVDTTTKSLIPLRLQFSGDVDHDDWIAYLSSIHAKMFSLESAPSDCSIWATTQLGDVYVFDHSTIKKQQATSGCLYKTDLSCKQVLSCGIPWEHSLNNGFPPDSVLTITGFISDNVERFSVNFDCESESLIALHFNPRFKEKCVVRNSFENGSWGNEEREGILTLNPGGDFDISFQCQEDGFKILLNGMVFTYFEHRIPPQKITTLRMIGNIELHSVVYESKEVIVPLNEMVWKQIGGHLVVVETCSSGVTWGISADNTPYVYTAGWGGAFLGGLQQTSFGIHPMTDTYCCYVYENQRWNPLSGFTSRGLPTDRPMWSDSTGHHKRSKETTRLLSMHWQWITDWAIDFKTPGGVDAEGWQYAVDFSTSYHARKHLTDYVRRRRWIRKCKLTTSGPWAEVGNSKVIDISLQESAGFDAVYVWAVGFNGDALFRKGVTSNNPMGDNWEHIPCDQALFSISCGFFNQVWAVTRNGSLYWRFGITASNPKGDVWEIVEPPKGSQMKKVSVARWAVWALDNDGHLFVRREVTPVFPEGTHWQSIPNIGCDSYVDISASGDEVWVIISEGMICRRTGVSCENPAGSSWDKGLKANWQYISVRSYTSKTLPRNRFFTQSESRENKKYSLVKQDFGKFIEHSVNFPRFLFNVLRYLYPRTK